MTRATTELVTTGPPPVPDMIIFAIAPAARRQGKMGDIMIGRLGVAVIVALALVWPHPAPAELVELNGGDWVQGALREVTPAGVVVEVGGQTVRFTRDRVRAIYFGPSSPQARPLGPQLPQSPTSWGPPPSVTPSAAADALQVLKSLRSAVLARIGLQEYQAKVTDAATILDRYLATLPSGSEKETVHDAARYYVLAASAWNNQGRVSPLTWLRKDDALDRCAMYQDFAEAMRSKGEAYYDERVQNYVVISDGVISVLWSCASEKIAEAETLLANAPK